MTKFNRIQVVDKLKVSRMSADIFWFLLPLILESFASGSEIMEEHSLINKGFVPSAGYSVVAGPSTASLGQCSASCRIFRGQCSGFTFEPSSCTEDDVKIPIGTCILLSLGRPFDVKMTPNDRGQIWLTGSYIAKNVMSQG